MHGYGNILIKYSLIYFISDILDILLCLFNNCCHSTNMMFLQPQQRSRTSLRSRIQQCRATVILRYLQTPRKRRHCIRNWLQEGRSPWTANCRHWTTSALSYDKTMSTPTPT